MASKGVASLPEELLLSIFECLDSTPPSELRARQEPSLQFTNATRHTLKDLSSVSRRWRRTVLPLLFKNARIRLDIPVRTAWLNCPHCPPILGEASSDGDIGRSQAHPDHVSMIAAMHARKDAVKESTNSEEVDEDVITTTTTPANFHHRPNEASTAAWAVRLHHAVTYFLDFMINAQLSSSIRSMALSSGQMLQGKLGRFPHLSGSREWRYSAAAVLWQHLLSNIDPDRIVIVAPPTELALLLNATIDTFGDW